MRQTSSSLSGTVQLAQTARPQPPPALATSQSRSATARGLTSFRSASELPQRVPSPPYLNSPRASLAAGAAAGAAGAGAGDTAGALAVPPSSEPLRLARKQAAELTSRTTLRDCQVLADACRRAGRTRLEGQCYFRIGGAV